MPTCNRSAADVRVPLAILALLFPVASAGAQESTRGDGQNSSVTARAGIESEGAAALDRIEKAVSARKAQVLHAPVLPQEPNSGSRRRAFDAMHSRAAMPAMEGRARSALEAGQAGFAQEREAMARRLGQALGLEAPSTEALAAGAVARASSARVPVLFVSSSMPIATLRTYASQLERVGGVLAFRGMPGGLARVAPMARLSAQILRLDPGCEGPACSMRNVQLIVDPVVFRQHGVTRVPALAMIPGDPSQPYCERDAESPRATQLVLGDAALAGMLEEYARLAGDDTEVRDAKARLEIR